MNSVYKTQCKTWLIAQKLACQFSNVSPIDAILKPPYCLRVVKEYRNIDVQNFRDQVARYIKEN
jgi:hypothetical protein